MKNFLLVVLLAVVATALVACSDPTMPANQNLFKEVFEISPPPVFGANSNQERLIVQPLVTKKLIELKTEVDNAQQKVHENSQPINNPADVNFASVQQRLEALGKANSELKQAEHKLDVAMNLAQTFKFSVATPEKKP